MRRQVTVISTSPGKKDEAMSRLGAHHFLVSKDAEAMQAAAGSLDGIIDTARPLRCRRPPSARGSRSN